MKSIKPYYIIILVLRQKEKGVIVYEGYQVSIKEDGREGLKEALENDYDLIILDIMLPSMNGFEICRRLKRKKILL